MTPAELLGASLPDLLAAAGAGCHEALFGLGEAPEDRYPASSEWLEANNGCNRRWTTPACFMTHSDAGAVMVA